MLLVIEVVTVLLAAATLLPFLPFAHGLVRVGDFPRQQILLLSVALIAVSLVLHDGRAGWTAALAGLFVIAAIQAWRILPFTPLWRPRSLRFDPDRDSRCQPFRLISCNVKMSNDRYGQLMRIVGEHDPDLLVLMEVDERWMRELEPLLENFSHVVARPQENSYGLVFASKFPLTDPQVRCLLTNDVPSIVSIVEMPDGQRFRFYAIHPEPPVPSHGSVGRDGETALVALRVRDEELPVVVSGDLNDVAWSSTTRRFREVSQLLDPRIGRKIFSTFGARNPLARWPLDHLFHSPQFRLKQMRRLPPCGSDHFPVLFDLAICPRADARTHPEDAEKAEMQRARNLVGKARKRDDEEPIGSDWER